LRAYPVLTRHLERLMYSSRLVAKSLKEMVDALGLEPRTR